MRPRNLSASAALLSLSSAARVSWLGRRGYSGIPAMVLDQSRVVLGVKGPDASTMLQGLVTNDVRLLGKPGTKGEDGVSLCPSMYTAFLSSKGRMLADTFVHYDPEDEERWLVDAPAGSIEVLKRHLTVHKFQSRVDIAVEDDALVVMCPEATASSLQWAEPAEGEEEVHRDPRLGNVETTLDLSRFVKSRAAVEKAAAGPEPLLSGQRAAEVYSVYRALVGLAEGSDEIPPQVALPLESNLDFLCGVSFNKGCYVGQELTARTHHRGVTRKRLLPVVITNDGRSHDADAILQTAVTVDRSYPYTTYEGALGTIKEEGGGTMGSLRASVKIEDGLSLGFAVLKLESVRWDEPTPCSVGAAKGFITPIPPQWWPEEE